MRKRTYTPLAGRAGFSDVLVEDIDAFYESHDRAARQEPAVESSVPQSSVHNLVGTAMIEKRFLVLDLRTISRLLLNCVYDQQKFAAITIRIHRPSCTVLLFTSGKMVLTGCRSYMQCVLAAHEVVRGRDVAHDELIGLRIGRGVRQDVGHAGEDLDAVLHGHAADARLRPAAGEHRIDELLALRHARKHRQHCRV